MTISDHAAFDAINSNDLEIVRSGTLNHLIDKYLHLDHFTENYCTQFSALDICKSVEMMEILLKRGGDLFKVNVFGDSLLHTYVKTYIHDHSVDHGVIDVIEYLLINGLDLTWRNACGRNVFEELENSYYGACAKKNEIIVDKIKNLFSRHHGFRKHCSGHVLRMDVDRLIECIDCDNLSHYNFTDNKSLLNYVDSNGVFPLYSAFENRNDESYKILVKNNASTYIRPNGDLFLSYVAESGTSLMRSCHFTKVKIKELFCSDMENGTYCLIARESNGKFKYEIKRDDVEIDDNYRFIILNNSTSGITEIQINLDNVPRQRLTFRKMDRAVKHIERNVDNFELYAVHDTITNFLMTD